MGREADDSMRPDQIARIRWRKVLLSDMDRGIEQHRNIDPSLMTKSVPAFTAH